MYRFYERARGLGCWVTFCTLPYISSFQGTFLVKIIYIYELIKVFLTWGSICALNHSIHPHLVFSVYFWSVIRTFYHISIHQKMQWLYKSNNEKFKQVLNQQKELNFIMIIKLCRVVQSPLLNVGQLQMIPSCGSCSVLISRFLILLQHGCYGLWFEFEGLLFIWEIACYLFRNLMPFGNIWLPQRNFFFVSSLFHRYSNKNNWTFYSLIGLP